MASFASAQQLLETSVSSAREEQITDRPGGHILTNTNVWSPDGRWIAYDTRSDPAGANFDGRTIEIVNVESREVRELYRSQNGAHCGAATFSPVANKVVFIVGPENPTDEWQYAPWHRRGAVVDIDQPGRIIALDARDLVAPYTSGALRGGTHLHVFSGDGAWVSFTYEDHVLAELDAANGAVDHDSNQRNIGVSVLGSAVRVPKSHPRNHDGAAFSTIVSRTVKRPRPGSDEIARAFEEAWVGTHGYVRTDGSHQRRAIAFQGNVVAPDGTTVAEAFLIDLPEDVTFPGDGPLCGTSTLRPSPPRGVTQRRLTHTIDRKYPGLQGPRHWLRSSPDGSQIGVLMRDDAGIVQLWTISPLDGTPRQLTRHPFDVASAFSWSPCGRWIAYVADNSVFVANAGTGDSIRLTARSDDAHAPRPEACVFSPDGSQIAFVRPVAYATKTWNQIFVVSIPTN